VAIPLDTSALADEFHRWIGRTITVGVRAESVTAVPSHEASPRVAGTVEFVEELGSEVIVHARVDELGPSADIAGAPESVAEAGHIASGTANLVAKLPARMTCRPGDAVTLFIDPGNIHCFDPVGPSLRKGVQA